MISIHLRPLEIDERVTPGHWEGDRTKGARKASGMNSPFVDAMYLRLKLIGRGCQRQTTPRKNPKGMLLLPAPISIRPSKRARRMESTSITMLSDCFRQFL